MILTAAGCLDAGQRAETGTCPDEPCSDATPRGLLFGGASFADDFLDAGIKITAIGGVQSVQLYDNTTGDAWTSRVDAFTIGDALRVRDALSGVVRIEGVEASTATLKIEDQDGLLDQISVEADRVAAIGLRPHPRYASRDGGDRPWLIWRGARASLLVELRADDDTLLVDEDLAMRSCEGAAVTEVGWDGRQVAVGPTAWR